MQVVVAPPADTSTTSLVDAVAADVDPVILAGDNVSCRPNARLGVGKPAYSMPQLVRFMLLWLGLHLWFVKNSLRCKSFNMRACCVLYRFTPQGDAPSQREELQAGTAVRACVGYWQTNGAGIFGCMGDQMQV